MKIGIAKTCHIWYILIYLVLFNAKGPRFCICTQKVIPVVHMALSAPLQIPDQLMQAALEAVALLQSHLRG